MRLDWLMQIWSAQRRQSDSGKDLAQKSRVMSRAWASYELVLSSTLLSVIMLSGGLNLTLAKTLKETPLTRMGVVLVGSPAQYEMAVYRSLTRERETAGRRSH